MKILIKNGTIVTPEKSCITDVLTENGIISYVGTDLPHTSVDMVIDAGGMYVLPGAVDPHVHMHLHTAAGYSSDDFLTGSRAALCGGTTTIIDFVTPVRGEPLPLALEKRMKEAGRSLADYTFHVSPVEWRSSTAGEITECIRMGITSFKVYMAYKDTIGLDDDDLLKVMTATGKAGGTVAVHCELGDAIEQLRNSYFESHHTSPIYHALSRPASLEATAVKKAIETAAAASCPLYIVHVSAAESLKYIREARKRQQPVYAEACPQYLLLDSSKYNGTFEQTAPFVMSPPLRSHEDSEALWETLANGTLNSVGTDHCPFTMKQKEAGIDDFRKIPGGAGGVEHRLSLLFTYGVLTNRLNINQLVNLVSTAPAKIFGLYPRKGSVAPGSDADLVIWDPSHESIISAQTHKMNCDINIYEGMPVKGRADYVIKGGEIVVREGQLTAKTISGNYLFRKPA